jgi:hypothetical protein
MLEKRSAGSDVAQAIAILGERCVCMAGQGHYISSETIQQVIHLLNSTEMTIREIAERMSISKSAVFAINRRFHVREYDGLRTRWRNANAPALTQVAKNSA